jgi:hypothetical protein
VSAALACYATCLQVWHTIQLLEHALNGTRAAAAAHANVELVCVGRHDVGFGWSEDAEVVVGSQSR